MGMTTTLRRLLDNWRKRESILAPVWSQFGYSPGPAIFPSKAFEKVGYVYRCVRAIYENAQQVPIFAAQQSAKSGKLEKLPSTHPLAMFLENPNPEDDLSGIIEKIFANLNLNGEALLELDVPEQPKALPSGMYCWPARWIKKVDIAADRYVGFHLQVQ